MKEIEGLSIFIWIIILIVCLIIELLPTIIGGCLGLKLWGLTLLLGWLWFIISICVWGTKTNPKEGHPDNFRLQLEHGNQEERLKLLIEEEKKIEIEKHHHSFWLGFVLGLIFLVVLILLVLLIN